MCLRRLADVEVEETEVEAVAKESVVEASTEIDKTIEEDDTTKVVRNDDAGGHP